MKNQLIINNKEVELSPESWKSIKEQFNKKSFYPEIGDTFYAIDSTDEKQLVQKASNYSNMWKMNFDCGLAYKTRPEAEAKLAEMQAITKVRKFIFEEGLSFEQKEDDYEMRVENWDIYYDLEDSELKSNRNKYYIKSYSPFGHLKSEEDCEKVIENCKDELKIIFKVKK